MSYAGVESEYEYQMRRHDEAVQAAARYRRERDPKYIAEQAAKERNRQLTSARAQLEFHRAKVDELRKMVRRLAREQS